MCWLEIGLAQLSLLGVGEWGCNGLITCLHLLSTGVYWVGLKVIVHGLSGGLLIIVGLGRDRLSSRNFGVFSCASHSNYFFIYPRGDPMLLITTTIIFRKSGGLGRARKMGVRNFEDLLINLLGMN